MTPSPLHALLEHGVPRDAAGALLGLAEGSVDKALALRPALAAKPRIIGLLRAVEARNWSLVGKVLRGAENGWDDAACEAFRLWLVDAISGVPRYFADSRESLERATQIPTRNLLAAHGHLQRNLDPDLRVSLAAHALLAS